MVDTPRTLSALQDLLDGPAPISRQSLLDLLVSVYPSVVDVERYGASTAASAAANSIAIQAALNDHANWDILALKNVYNIDATLNVPVMYGKHILGDSRETCGLLQTANVPILKVADSLHSLRIADLSLSFSTQQTTTSGVAIQFAPASGAENLYWSIFERLRIDKAYYGFATGGAGIHAWWGNRFSDILMTAVKQTAFHMLSPTSAGQPVSVFENIQVHNTNTSVVSTGPCFRFGAVEALMLGVDVEGWQSAVFEITGGNHTQVYGLHVENHIWPVGGSFPYLGYVADEGSLTIRGGKLKGISQLTSGHVRLFLTGANARLHLEAMQWHWDLQGAGTMRWMTGGASTAAIYLKDNFALTGTDSISYPCDAADTTTKSFIKQLDGWFAPTSAVTTFTAADTTPTVQLGRVFKTNNGGATSITTFDDGQSGQEITVILDANTTLVNGAALKLAGAVNLVATANDVVRLVYDGTAWYEVGRSLN